MQCKDLVAIFNYLSYIGVFKDDLQIKAKDAFRDAKRNDEIVSLRFSNYVHRFNATVKSIVKERKKIMNAPKLNKRPRTTSNYHYTIFL
jgi:hypothetical protein